MSATAVEPLPEVMGRGLSLVPAWLTPLSEQDVHEVGQRVTAAALEVEVENLLGAHLAHADGDRALYVALGVLPPDDPRAARLLERLADEAADDEAELQRDSVATPADYLLGGSGPRTRHRGDLSMYRWGGWGSVTRPKL